MNRFYGLVLGVALTVSASATAQTLPVTVSQADGLVTVRAAGAPLADIFDRLVAQGLVTLTGKELLATSVSLDIERRPIDVVVSALLADYDFIISVPRPAAGRPVPTLRVAVHAVRDPSAVAKGPVFLAELRAFRAADLAADLLDPVDPTEDEETQAAAKEALEDQATEEAEQIAELAERERAGAFDRQVAVDALVELLEEDNPRIRQRALTELNARESTEALAGLLKSLDDVDSATRYHGIDLLGGRTDAASLARLGAILVNGKADKPARYGAFMAIAARADLASVSFVERVADDADPIINASAATFLQEMARRKKGAASATPQRPPGNSHW